MGAAETVREGIVRFDPQDGIYTDHFPGYPVVPGSLIIQAFLDLAGPVREIEEFRFRSFLAPGIYRYRMTRRTDRWDCTLLKDEQILVRGKMKG